MPHRRWTGLAVCVALLAGCGGGGDVELRLRYPDAVDAASVRGLEDRTERELERRLEALGIDGKVETQAGDYLVTVPEAEEDTVRQVLVQPGRLRIADWEGSLVGANGRVARDPKPDPAAGTVRDALTQDQLAQRMDRHRGPSIPLRVADAPAGAPRVNHLLAGPAALTGRDIDRAEALGDAVTLTLNSAGREKFQELTRELAQRGQEHALPGTDVLAVVSHFVIAVDGEILSTPYVDFHENPNGIDGSNGVAISGGMTRAEAEGIAARISPDELPGPLEVVK